MKSTKEEDKSLGLGDTVDKITTATGIKKAVKFLFGEDCGCEERRKKWNKSLSYINCLTEEEYTYLKEWFDSNSTTIDFKTRQRLTAIRNRVFKINIGCSKCEIKNTLKELKRVYNEYK